MCQCRPSGKRSNPRVLRGLRVGLTGFEPATSWSRTKTHYQETTGNQGNSDDLRSGCTSPADAAPDHPPSPLVAALLTVLQNLSPSDRDRLAAALAAGGGEGRCRAAVTPPGD